METGGKYMAHLALPVMISGQRLTLPRKPNSACQPPLALPMGTRCCRHPHAVLAQKGERLDLAGAEKMRLPLPIPPQQSTRKLPTK